MPGPVMPEGATVWLTGLPSSGKTTIAGLCATALADRGRRVEVLDGDRMREILSPDAGFGRADRERHVRRVAHVALLLARHEVVVFVPVIAPFQASRAEARALHDEAGVPFVEVHVAAPVDVCARRDVKGLYARQAAGTLTGLTGVDAPYEVPPAPELRIRTDLYDEATCAARVLDALASSCPSGSTSGSWA